MLDITVFKWKVVCSFSIDESFKVTWNEHAIPAVVLGGVVMGDVLAEDSWWGWYTPPATPPSNISYKLNISRVWSQFTKHSI